MGEPKMDEVMETGKGLDFDFSLGGKNRELRTMSNAEFNKFPAGQTGADLEDVVSHGENLYGTHGLVDEEFLDELHADHTKIKELMDKLGETRDEVSIVARTEGGGFTRMLLKKQPNGKYEEIKENVDSHDKTKSHRQEKDLFIFEKGAMAMAA